MRIGLVTVYYANFGSYFQTAALKDQLEQMGHECVVVNASLRGPRAAMFLVAAALHKRLPSAVNRAISERVAAYRIYDSLANSIARWEITPVFRGRRWLSRQFDCVLVGSDELWSASLGEMGYVPAYFGIGIDAPLVSYATSGASIDEDAGLPWDDMACGLKKFESLSARDDKTCDLVGRLTGRQCTRCVDPTLLNPFFIPSELPDHGGYLLIYGVRYDEAAVLAIQKIARDRGLTIRGISWKHPFLDEFVEPASPDEFVQQFAHASFVVPSTFHGTVFSILTHRPFASYLMGSKATKVQDLLTHLGLADRVANGIDDLNALGPIDYEQVERRLSDLRDESMAYLVDALRHVEGVVNR